MLKDKRILLIISGGIAAYKSLDLIRRLKAKGWDVTGVLTKGAQEFITPLSVTSLTGNKAHIDLFDAADINTSASAFNTEKLLWLNQHYIKTNHPKR